MKRFLAVLTVLLLLLCMTSGAFALETWLFTMDYEPSVYDTVGELTSNNTFSIQIFPYAAQGDTVSQIMIAHFNANQGVADMTIGDIKKYADLNCSALEAMRDGTSIYTDAVCTEYMFVDLDGVRTAYFQIETTWNSVNIAGASSDAFVGIYIADFEDSALMFQCMTFEAAKVRELNALVRTLSWKSSSSGAPQEQVGLSRLGTVYNYGDFNMAYTPGGNDIAGAKSASSFVYTIYPFTEMGDSNTAAMIVWQPETMNFESMSSNEVQSISYVMLRGFMDGQAQIGLEGEFDLLACNLTNIDGYTAIRADAVCTYDLSAFGYDMVSSVYATLTFVPSPLGGMYAFVGMTNSYDMLEATAEVFASVTWND